MVDKENVICTFPFDCLDLGQEEHGLSSSGIVLCSLIAFLNFARRNLFGNISCAAEGGRRVLHPCAFKETIQDAKLDSKDFSYPPYMICSVLEDDISALLLCEFCENEPSAKFLSNFLTNSEPRTKTK